MHGLATCLSSTEMLCIQHAGLLLPPEIHREVSPSQLLAGRLLVVGDVHGCIEELHELLRKVNYVQGEDNLIFTGDLGDKGPFSIKASPICILFPNEESTSPVTLYALQAILHRLQSRNRPS